MAICPICRVNEADKKNSHLIPFFLIKKCITHEGSGHRDMEFSFTISPQNFSKLYTGAGILPEYKEDYNNLSELQKEEENPYAKNDILCYSCEANLSRLEAIFASQFPEKKLKAIEKQAGLVSLYGNSIITFPHYNTSLYELLIQSIFYRCSIGQFNGFTLEKIFQLKVEENLRHAFLYPNFKKINSTSLIPIPHRFPIITCVSLVNKNNDPTTNSIVVNQSRFPYFIMAGNWMFQLFEGEKHLKSSVEWLYGLRDCLKAVEIFTTIKNHSHVVILGEGNSRVISNNLLHYVTTKRIEGLYKRIRHLYYYLFNRKADNTTVQYIYQQFFYHLNKGKTEVSSLVDAFNDLRKL